MYFPLVGSWKRYTAVAGAVCGLASCWADDAPHTVACCCCVVTTRDAAASPCSCADIIIISCCCCCCCSCCCSSTRSSKTSIFSSRLRFRSASSAAWEWLAVSTSDGTVAWLSKLRGVTNDFRSNLGVALRSSKLGSLRSSCRCCCWRCCCCCCCCCCSSLRVWSSWLNKTRK